MIGFLTKASAYVVPVYIAVVLLCVIIKKVDAYPVFLDGAKEGIANAFSILPYMIGMLFAIELVKASGLMSFIGKGLDKALICLGVPNGLSLFMLLGPLSGSAALAELSELYVTFGPDSAQGRLASILMGSTETILYTIPIYLGAAKIKDSGKALSASLVSTLVGTFAGIIMMKIFFGT